MKKLPTVGVMVLLVILIGSLACSHTAPILSSLTPTSTVPPTPTSTPLLIPTPAIYPIPTLPPELSPYRPTPLLPTLIPTETPTISTTPISTMLPISGGGGGGALPIHTFMPTATPVPTPTPTPRLLAYPERLLPSSVQRGSSFNVTLSFSSPYGEFNAILVQDTFPSGWSVEETIEWCVPEANYTNIESGAVEYIWNGPYGLGEGFEVLYEVLVPEDAPLGTYSFCGALTYYIAGTGPYSENIVGDSQITVVN